ncbi:MAG: hypothetical protein PHG80_09155 [Methanoregulaceae archaeon]|nr:hypothetical protein [Methanoregulaceae archaeon]
MIREIYGVMGKVFVLGLILILSLCMQCIADESGYVSDVEYGYIDIPSCGYSARMSSSPIKTLYWQNIQQYKNVELIVLHCDRGGIDSVQGEFILQGGLTTIGTGTITSFHAGGTTDTVHIQFDTFNNNHGFTGSVSLQLAATSGSIPSVTEKGVGDDTGVLNVRTAAGSYAYFSSGAIYYTTPYSNWYLYEDHDTFGYVAVNRVAENIGDTVESTVTVMSGGETILTEHKISGMSSCYVLKNPVVMYVEFAQANISKTFTIPNATYYSPVTTTPTTSPIPTSPMCDKEISLTLSKYTQFFPYEYITGSISLTGDAPLQSISWMKKGDTGSEESPVTFAQFTNVSGTWYVYRNDLGNITTSTPTTYEDAISESIRFASSGYKTVRVAAFTQTSCNVYDEKQCNVYPTSAGTNLHINFRDCINGNMLGFATASIENVGITGNVTYSGNPISVSANPGDILSIYATSPGYTPNHVNYTVLSAPSGGNSMEVPFYLCPEEMDEIYPGNTTLIINVKSLSGGQSIEGASVHAGYGGTTISSAFTNSAGYSMLQIPYHAGYTKVDVASYPYNAQTKYLQLLNASSYEDTFYLTLGATTSPTPTPTPSSTSPWFTPTQTTMTTAPTSTTTSNPKLVVVVSDATTGNPMAGAEVKIYWAGEYDETYKDYRLSAITGEDGKTSPIQMYSGEAYYCDVSASGYYTSSERFLMADADSTRYVQMVPLGSGVTTAPTTPSGGLPNIDIGDGNATGWVSMFIDKVMELFGVNDWAARVLLGLLTTLIGAVFVGGCLAGYGSGEGAGMGALIGGCFGWIASTILGFIPVWLLPVSIAFVGLAFFVWRGGGKE